MWAVIVAFAIVVAGFSWEHYKHHRDIKDKTIAEILDGVLR